ncbi:hypothetical protein DM02DRAFT_612823 [Periconia macrospinosa]|uniref:Uncharacterized protein n=1 Tax=Periconia macrospinosa TaxID=97972 RepID=A0A2V1DW57_9PLEO|nr:hypothetical protein DM02DRAFT_612823 [Periconia macrospinosa]
MTDQKPDPNGNVWKLSNIASNYWDEYLATRPKYESTIFTPILEYHTSCREVALDIRFGASSALDQLTKHFQKVVASDNDPTSLLFTQN